MVEVASRELRNNTRKVLALVEAGESVTVTVGGRAVATLVPADRRVRWMSRGELARRILAHPADPGLLADVRGLTPETTDDLPL
ncbi:MAG: type II toxin-antitoxin system prevent-host-death family antitoxin [Chloroflexota bacterium]